MALTKEEIIAKFLPTMLKKRRFGVKWEDISAAITNASIEQKGALKRGVKDKDYASIGRTLSEMVMAGIVVEVQADLESKLANDSLNINELSDIFA
jgi:hypothetical protein